MDRINMPLALIISLTILALSLFYLGGQIGAGLKNFRNYERSVTMKGLAEQDVTADLALWTLSYAETGNNLSELQTLMETHGQKIKDFLKSNGVQEEEITLKSVQVQDLMAQSYRQNYAADNRYILTQTYLVRTEEINDVATASREIGKLIRQGIVFAQHSSTSPTYLYTQLNEIKPDMIAEATRNARKGAREFARNSGQKVGTIKQASQGVFQILPRDKSHEVQESQEINKTVRVVSTIEFYLED
jgi:hypothetical protein